jgi:hypothetical protein
LFADHLQWIQASPNGSPPVPRRAHTATYYVKENMLIIFGGGNGENPLNDLYALQIDDLSCRRGNTMIKEKLLLHWEKIEATGQIPPARGYHTANLTGDYLIVCGGSDGKDCYADIYMLHLGKADI